MSRENAKLIYLSGVALILVVCVIMVLGESRRTGSNCKQSNQQVCLEQVQCDTTQCDSTKCDSIKCDQRVGK
jgi:hypothetical protein